MDRMSGTGELRQTLRSTASIHGRPEHGSAGMIAAPGVRYGCARDLAPERKVLRSCLANGPKPVTQRTGAEHMRWAVTAEKLALSAIDTPLHAS